MMLLHWVTNDNACILTLIEKNIRHVLYGTVQSSTECFAHQLVAPIYDFNKNNQDISGTIYFVTLSLWLIGLYRLSTRKKI